MQRDSSFEANCTEIWTWGMEGPGIFARAEVPKGQARASAGLESSFHWPEVK